MILTCERRRGLKMKATDGSECTTPLVGDRSWLRSVRTGVAPVVLVATALCGCATITHGEPETVRSPIGTTRETVPTKRYVATVDQDARNLAIKLEHACEIVERNTLKVTTTRERQNGSSTRDWLLAGGGLTLLTAGTATLVDAPNVYPHDADSRTYNAVGKSGATAIGAGLLAAGVALTAVPAADAIRSIGSERSESIEAESSFRVISRSVPCKGKKVSNLAVVGRVPSGDNLDLGAIDVPGTLSLELESVVLEAWLLRNRGDELELIINAQKAGSVSLQAFREAYDKKRWDAAEARACAEPEAVNACDGVKAYVDDYPKGERASEARKLLEDALPRLAQLRERAAWNLVTPESCRAPVTETGCRTVEGYLAEYASGAHAEEARAVLNGSAKAIAKLKTKAEADARAAQRKAEAQALAEQRKAEAEALAERRREEAAVRRAQAEAAAEQRRQEAEERRAAAAALRECTTDCRDACVMRRYTGGRLEACARMCVRSDCGTGWSEPAQCRAHCRDGCIVNRQTGDRLQACTLVCSREMCNQ